jgi:hypothetical protein
MEYVYSINNGPPSIIRLLLELLRFTVSLQKLMISGLGDNIERYDEMFESFKEEGIKTIGMDLRGFGRTFELQNEDRKNGNYRFMRTPILKGYTQVLFPS